MIYKPATAYKEDWYKLAVVQASVAAEGGGDGLETAESGGSGAALRDSTTIHCNILINYRLQKRKEEQRRKAWKNTQQLSALVVESYDLVSSSSCYHLHPLAYRGLQLYYTCATSCCNNNTHSCVSSSSATDHPAPLTDVPVHNLSSLPGPLNFGHLNKYLCYLPPVR